MAVRYLTKRFMAYVISEFEKKHKKEFLDFLDIGNLSVGKMIILVQMGNGKGMTEEEAGERIDEYAKEHGLIDTYVQILDELDRDTQIIRASGTSIEEIRDNLNRKVETETDLDITVESKDETVLKEGEEPKVDVNGFVSLD